MLNPNVVKKENSTSTSTKESLQQIIPNQHQQPVNLQVPQVPRPIQKPLNLNPNQVWTEAQMLFRSGLISVKSPEEIIPLIMHGHSLGLSAVVSVTNLSIKKGRLVIRPEIIHGLISSSPVLENIRVTINETDDETTVMIKRTDRPNKFHAIFSNSAANALNLYDRPLWKAHASAMRMERAFIQCARMAYPEICWGAITEDELMDEDQAKRSRSFINRLRNGFKSLFSNRLRHS